MKTKFKLLATIINVEDDMRNNWSVLIRKLPEDEDISAIVYKNASIHSNYFISKFIYSKTAALKVICKAIELDKYKMDFKENYHWFIKL